MAGIKITTDIQDEELQRALRRLQRTAVSPTAFWKDVGEYLLESVEGRFTEQKDPAGKAWEALAESTLARKRHPKILTERMMLRGSITYRAGRSSVEVGTNKIYGRIHQLGGLAGRRSNRVRIPARPYLGLSAADREEVGALLLEHLEEALRRG